MGKVYSCLIWGIGGGYDRIKNSVDYEVLKGNLKIIALITQPCPYTGSRYDGIVVIRKEEIKHVSFDYVIVASEKYYEDIIEEAKSYKIPRGSMIDGRVFLLPLFDFSRYVNLIQNRITILSDDCWSGYIYHWMHMQFYTPLINIFWQKNSYMQFIENPEYYLSFPLAMERQADVRKNRYAIGSLGEGKDKVYLDLVHAASFEDAKKLWERRVLRINKKNLFVKLALDVSDENSERYLEIFSKVPHKKICFYSGKTDCSHVVYLRRFEHYVLTGSRMDTINYYDYVRNIYELSKGIDLFKMLNGEKEFLREDGMSSGGGQHRIFLDIAWCLGNVLCAAKVA